MFVEERKAGGGKKYYLVHSFRYKGKVKKIRRYLGKNLSPEQLERAKPIAGQQIRGRVKVYKSIRDPFTAVLSAEELEMVENLEKRSHFKVFHLSEDEWHRFSEIFSYNTNAIEGSEVTQSEVEQIIDEEKWPAYKTKEDISETYGVVEAVSFIRKTKEHVSVSLIKELHRIVFKNSKPFAGQLRRLGVEV
ncbi:MAG: hypothetical protein V1911_03840, partial [Candidatus Micrarchaeota archaeon]